MELPAASRNRSGNLPDSPEQTQLLQQARRDSTANVSQHHGLARFNSKDVRRIHTHIRATDDDRLYTGHRPRKRGHESARSGLLNSKFFVTLYEVVEITHADSPRFEICSTAGL